MATRREIQDRVQAMEAQVDSKMASGAGPNRDRIKGILEALGLAWGTPPSSPQLDSAADRVKSNLGETIKVVMKNLLTLLGTPTVGPEVPTAACGAGLSLVVTSPTTPGPFAGSVPISYTVPPGATPRGWLLQDQVAGPGSLSISGVPATCTTGTFGVWFALGTPAVLIAAPASGLHVVQLIPFATDAANEFLLGRSIVFSLTG